jgi:hypothetical protein
MNPYVYSKKRSSSRKSKRENSISLVSGLAKHVFGATISTAMAFAIVVYAAGSVAAMTAVAYQEIGGGADAPVVVRVAQAKVTPQVLGETVSAVPVLPQLIIDDSALEAQEPVAKISVKPSTYDSASGRWSYIIKYSLSNIPAGATLSIGNFPILSGLNASGAIETGAILKPGKEYRVSLWVTDSALGKQVLAKASIKTGNKKGSEDDQKIMTMCSAIKDGKKSEKPTMCQITKEGKTICPMPAECQTMMQKP